MYILVNPGDKPLIALCSVPNEAWDSNWSWTAWTKLCLELTQPNFYSPNPDIQCTKINLNKGVPHDQSSHSSMGEGFRNDTEKMREKEVTWSPMGMVRMISEQNLQWGRSTKAGFVSSWKSKEMIHLCKSLHHQYQVSLQNSEHGNSLGSSDFGLRMKPGKSVPVKGVIWFAAKFPSPRSRVLQPEIKIKRAVSTLLQAAYQQRGDIPETHYIQYTWEMGK